MKTTSTGLMVLVAANVVFSSGPATGGETSTRYEQPQLLSGTVYGAGPAATNVLFKFKRTATRSNDTVTAQREYTYPDGKPAARERAVYQGDKLVSYEMEELQINARGTAKVSRSSKTGPTINFEYVADLKSPGKTKVNTEPLKPDTLVNDMIAPFLAANWNTLMAGGEVRTRYIAASRAETVGFTFVKHSESMWRGKPVVIVKMSATSFIIAALVDPLYFTMEKGGEHRVLKYEGRTTPKIKDGMKWKDLDAVTVFDWD